MNVLEINDPAAAKELLARTGLDIVLAGQTSASFQAAHNHTESVLVLEIDGTRTVWQLTGAPKHQRKAKADAIRATLGPH